MTRRSFFGSKKQKTDTGPQEPATQAEVLDDQHESVGKAASVVTERASDEEEGAAAAHQSFKQRVNEQRKDAFKPDERKEMRAAVGVVQEHATSLPHHQKQLDSLTHHVQVLRWELHSHQAAQGQDLRVWGSYLKTLANQLTFVLDHVHRVAELSKQQSARANMRRSLVLTGALVGMSLAALVLAAGAATGVFNIVLTLLIPTALGAALGSFLGAFVPEPRHTYALQTQESSAFVSVPETVNSTFVSPEVPEAVVRHTRSEPSSPAAAANSHTNHRRKTSQSL